MSALRLPQDRTVARRLRLSRGIGSASDHPSPQTAGLDHGAQGEVAGLVDPHTDLLQHDGRRRPAGEGHDLDLGDDARRLVAEAAGQLRGGEIIGLDQVRDRRRLVAEPDVVEGEIAGQRIGRRGSSLDPALRMFSREAADDRHAGLQRLFAHAQPNQSVPDIGR